MLGEKKIYIYIQSQKVWCWSLLFSFKLLKRQKIIELSPFSLFTKPGSLTLKQHSDRDAKRKKGLQEKNRREGEKALERVSVV